jgi:hypothetical protein
MSADQGSGTRLSSVTTVCNGPHSCTPAASVTLLQASLAALSTICNRKSWHRQQPCRRLRFFWRSAYWQHEGERPYRRTNKLLGRSNSVLFRWCRCVVVWLVCCTCMQSGVQAFICNYIYTPHLCVGECQLSAGRLLHCCLLAGLTSAYAVRNHSYHGLQLGVANDMGQPGYNPAGNTILTYQSSLAGGHMRAVQLRGRAIAPCLVCTCAASAIVEEYRQRPLM